MPDLSIPCNDHYFGTYSSSAQCAECRILIKRFLLEAAKEFDHFDSVAFTGSSGAAFGYWLADELGVHPVHVLKSSEKPHGSSVRGRTGTAWLFLDDFCESGATYKRVCSALESEPVGALFYLASDAITCVRCPPCKAVWRSKFSGEPETWNRREETEETEELVVPPVPEIAPSGPTFSTKIAGEWLCGVDVRIVT